MTKLRKKGLFAFMLVLMLFVSIFGCFGTNIRAKATSSEVELLNIALAHLKEQVDALETAIDTKADEEEVNAKMAELDAAVAAMTKELNGIKKKMEELENKNAELQTVPIIACVVSSVTLSGCGAFVIWFFIDRKKRFRT